MSKPISLPLSIIFNKSILIYHYPLAFKTCIVTPLFKSGDKLIYGNYPSISLSLTLSKIFEKCIKKRLIHSLEKKSFFSNSQFSFRIVYQQLMQFLGLINLFAKILIKIIKLWVFFWIYKRLFIALIAHYY